MDVAHYPRNIRIITNVPTEAIGPPQLTMTSHIERFAYQIDVQNQRRSNRLKQWHSPVSLALSSG
jgi:hypothetical protein